MQSAQHVSSKSFINTSSTESFVTGNRARLFTRCALCSRTDILYCEESFLDRRGREAEKFSANKASPKAVEHQERLRNRSRLTTLNIKYINNFPLSSINLVMEGSDESTKLGGHRVFSRFFSASDSIEKKPIEKASAIKTQFPLLLLS